MLLSIVAILFYTPTSSTQGIQFLHNITDTCYFLICFVLILAILLGVKWVQYILTKCTVGYHCLNQDKKHFSHTLKFLPSHSCAGRPLTSHYSQSLTLGNHFCAFWHYTLAWFFSASFTQNNVLEIHSSYHCISRLLKSTPLHEYSAICPFICWWAFELSPVAAVSVSMVHVNTLAHVFLWIWVFTYLR